MCHHLDHATSSVRSILLVHLDSDAVQFQLMNNHLELSRSLFALDLIPRHLEFVDLARQELNATNNLLCAAHSNNSLPPISYTMLSSFALMELHRPLLALKDVVQTTLASKELVVQSDAQLDRTLLDSVHLDLVGLEVAIQKLHVAKNLLSFQCALMV